MIETIKLWGSVAGLATAAFTIWDRLIRGRPLVSLKIAGVPTNAIKSVLVQNISAIDILITGIVAYPTRFRIAKDESGYGILHAVVDGTVVALIPPSETRDFPMFASPAIDEKEPNRYILILLYWRKSNSTWIKQLPKIILTSTKDLSLMATGLS